MEASSSYPVVLNLFLYNIHWRYTAKSLEIQILKEMSVDSCRENAVLLLRLEILMIKWKGDEILREQRAGQAENKIQCPQCMQQTACMGISTALQLEHGLQSLLVWIEFSFWFSSSDGAAVCTTLWHAYPCFVLLPGFSSCLLPLGRGLETRTPFIESENGLDWEGP